MASFPVFFSPATPSELATYVSTKCGHPTTLIICMSQKEFDYALTEDIAREMRVHNPSYRDAQNDDGGGQESDLNADERIEGNQDLNEDVDMSVMPKSPDTAATWVSPLLQQSIRRVAIAKHIRVVYMPSVSHLRAWLTVFPPANPEAVGPPPPSTAVAATTTFTRKTDTTPLLLLYGFLDLHRDTSEWSAQGLGSSAATLVDAARQAGLRAAIVEPRLDWNERVRDSEALLGEEIRMLSNAERKAAARGYDVGGGGWTGRTVAVGRVLARWFRFREGPWVALREVPPAAE